MRSYLKPLPFIQGSRLSAASRQTNYVVRLFHPRGWYPRACICSDNAIYMADDDVVFMVTLATPWRVFDADAQYSEMDWLMPEEIRFLGSIFLCQKWEDAKLSFYPLLTHAPRIAKRKLDLANREVIQRVRHTLLHHVQRPGDAYCSQEIYDCSRIRYHLISEDRFRLAFQPEYWKRLSAKDYVLFRGISALIKADMLARYPEFIEEAAMQAFVALEASFQLVLRQLRHVGHTNPTARNAATWLFEHFDKPLGREIQTVEKYFEQFYEQRIKAFHPSSRFGEAPYAPLMADDYCDLRDSLPEIFAFLVMGTHSQDFLDEAKRFAERK